MASESTGLVTTHRRSRWLGGPSAAPDPLESAPGSPAAHATVSVGSLAAAASPPAAAAATDDSARHARRSAAAERRREAAIQRAEVERYLLQEKAAMAALGRREAVASCGRARPQSPDHAPADGLSDRGAPAPSAPPSAPPWAPLLPCASARYGADSDAPTAAHAQSASCFGAFASAEVDRAPIKPMPAASLPHDLTPSPAAGLARSPDRLGSESDDGSTILRLSDSRLTGCDDSSEATDADDAVDDGGLGAGLYAWVHATATEREGPARADPARADAMSAAGAGSRLGLPTCTRGAQTDARAEPLAGVPRWTPPSVDAVTQTSTSVDGYGATGLCGDASSAPVAVHPPAAAEQRGAAWRDALSSAGHRDAIVEVALEMARWLADVADGAVDAARTRAARRAAEAAEEHARATATQAANAFASESDPSSRTASALAAAAAAAAARAATAEATSAEAVTGATRRRRRLEHGACTPSRFEGMAVHFSGGLPSSGAPADPDHASAPSSPMGGAYRPRVFDEVVTADAMGDTEPLALSDIGTGRPSASSPPPQPPPPRAKPPPPAVSRQMAELSMRLQAARSLDERPPRRPSTPRRRRWQSAAIGALAAHRTRQSRRPTSIAVATPPQLASWFHGESAGSAGEGGTAPGVVAWRGDRGRATASAGGLSEGRHGGDAATATGGFQVELGAPPTHAPPHPPHPPPTPINRASVPPTLSVSTPPGMPHRCAAELADPRAPSALATSTPPGGITRGAEAADSLTTSSSRRGWQRLRLALRGPLRLGRSTERSSRGRSVERGRSIERSSRGHSVGRGGDEGGGGFAFTSVKSSEPEIRYRAL